MRLLKKLLLLVLLASSAWHVGVVHAQSSRMSNLTPQQIEQFQRLPESQQRLLARQYGIDIDQIQQQAQQSQENREQLPQIFPRGTEFDENGQPIYPEQIQRLLQQQDDEELKRFGIDVYANQPQTYTPLKNAPVPADYLVGPGDILSIQLYGKENRQLELEINASGDLVFPELGAVSVAGLSFTEAKTKIANMVKGQLIGTQVITNLSELRAIQIFVVGEAYEPGAYMVNSLTTISQAISYAGGFSEIGSMRSVTLNRGGKTIAEFDLYDMLLKGDTSGDQRLQSNDVIFIPAVSEQAAVTGEVVRPAIYEIKDETTLEQLIEMAGGLKPTASSKNALLKRFKQGDRVLHRINLQQATIEDMLVRNGDELTIRAGNELAENRVTLIGAINHPGTYAWEQGLTVSDLVSSVQRDLQPIADVNYALIAREVPATGELSVLQFSPAKAASGDKAHDLALQPSDMLIFFGRYESKQEERQAIHTLNWTENERRKRERERLLRDYKERYVEELLTDDEKSQAEQREEALKQQRELESLFAYADTEQEEETLEEDEYSDVSRYVLLKPLMTRLREQSQAGKRVPLVSVDGEVHYPGIYPLPINGELNAVLQAAGGLKDSAFLERAEISRMVMKAGEANIEHIEIQPSEILSASQSIDIQGRDRVNILAIPKWQESVQVKIEGEVRFPGTYTISRGDTLSDLLKRVGGLTEFADDDGAVFTRQYLKEQERERMRRLAQDLQREILTNNITNTEQAGNVSYSELRNLLRDLTSIEPVGRMVIDLPQILAGNKNRDIMLRDGDTLTIPSVNNSVNIIGEVQLASSYRYDPSLTVEQYIEMSGGVKGKADQERIYIIRANGSVVKPKSSWFSVSADTQLQPGDTIVVPLDTQYIDNLNLWNTATQIVYQASVAIAAIAGL